ncbi:cobaltochelatase subunit CobN [Deinococcus ruber]|uniref:Cobaltochelatase subunit CobN n=1 Tax=Deinococcus ruber TaxID=1848197 RepID=A0A918FBP0_9DEIO|nr:cobaltochelatase subunit CobN [Deinococcus ruber]GGR19637.1 cobaltochelatase subunit CobN [Deinococcus ruber]
MADATIPRTVQRQKVTRADGKTVNIVQRRGHLSYCSSGCCCGHVDRGYAPLPVDAYKNGWISRKLRNTVHLTRSGCLGPCTLANVASLMFDGRSVWFHNVNTPWQVELIYDYIERMIQADRFLTPPPELAEYVFNFYDWDFRTPPEQAELPAAPTGPLAGIAVLSHADTDLLTLERVRGTLPEGFAHLHTHPLQRVRSEEAMDTLLAGALGSAAVLLLRVHGNLSGVPGFAALQAQARTRGQHVAVISGVGDLDPEFARAGSVPLDLLETLTTAFVQGGVEPLGQALRALSDRLLLTGFGSEAVRPTAEHGVYLPELENATREDWQQQADPARPTVGLLFYRAHLLSGNTGFVDALLEALSDAAVNGLAVYTSSLKALENGVPAALALMQGQVDAVISTLSFALGEVNSGDVTQPGQNVSALCALGVPVVQAVASGMARGAWALSSRGLSPLDTAMNVAIPEFDGRIIGVPVSFKENVGGGTVYVPDLERVARVAGIAARQAALRHTANRDKRIAFVLTNSGAKAASVGNAVGLDAPASLLNLLRAMRGRGYALPELPAQSDTLIHDLLSRGSYDDAHPLDPARAHRYRRSEYLNWYGDLPATPHRRMTAQWGEPKAVGPAVRAGTSTLGKNLSGGLPPSGMAEPWGDAGHYHFAALELGNALVALQPPRGYGMDPDAIYHQPDLPPTHHYAAFYRWLTSPAEEGGWGANAIVHVGKHGTLEWLPGKGVGLSGECFPDLLLGNTPLVYPFIINDPGEGSQAKRRAHAVVVDHLTPPMTSAETYGPLAELNALVNEYYAVEKLDPSKLPLLQGQIWKLVRDTNLQTDLDLKTMLSRDHGDHTHDWDDELTEEGVPVSLAEMDGSGVAHLLEDLDGYLCELGLAQIRDGLHVMGTMPPLPEMLRALTRLPNAGVPGMQGSLAGAFGLDLAALLARPGERLPGQLSILGTPCYSHADLLERLDSLSLELLTVLEDGGFQEAGIEPALRKVLGLGTSDLHAVLRFVCSELVPNLEQVDDEVQHTLDALEGRYVPAGPSGAPTRGMAHILPTGRNFYAVDPRALPSQAAWTVGQALARETAERYRAEHGSYPEMVGLSAWGTSQMRTHGDDVAQALALMGARPRWNATSRRLEGVEAMPLAELGRPRIDVTLRISGFFRDAFPHLIDLLDDAVTLVTGLDEDPAQNFPRKHYLAELDSGQAEDETPEAHDARARYRVFGAKPGSYGAGILPLIETGTWQGEADFARAFLEWGGYAYTRAESGTEAKEVFASRLRSVQVALHNQDNREHDIFDSDDYLQFHGGMIATIRSLTGVQPATYFGDTSRPERAAVRDLKEETLRVYRSRVVNPKWLDGIRRHGYKGGLELAATVDYLFGYDATAQVAPDFVYEGLAQTYALESVTRAFLEQSNPWALNAIASRLLEAAERGLWDAPDAGTLDALRGVLLGSEALLEERGEQHRGVTS